MIVLALRSLARKAKLVTKTVIDMAAKTITKPITAACMVSLAVPIFLESPREVIQLKPEKSMRQTAMTPRKPRMTRIILAT